MMLRFIEMYFPEMQPRIDMQALIAIFGAVISYLVCRSRHICHSSGVDLQSEAGCRRLGADLTEALAQQGGGWFIITSRGNTVADGIDTGRRLERLALMAREYHIAIHPMTQILEEEEGRQEFAQNHGSDSFPQFVLRVGYLSRYPEPVSLRRPVNWFVKTGTQQFYP